MLAFQRSFVSLRTYPRHQIVFVVSQARLALVTALRAKHQTEFSSASAIPKFALVEKNAIKVGQRESTAMLKIAKILCVIDPTSEAQSALVRAYCLAEATGAGIELLICHNDQYLTDRRFVGTAFLGKERQEILHNHSRHLEQLATPIRAEGTTVWAAAISDLRLHKGIVTHALERKVDIVFKDTHHHAALSRALFSHSDWNLIRNCPMPLWLVKPRDDFDSPTFIAPIDPVGCEFQFPMCL